MKRDSEGSFVLASDVGAGNSHADALTEERRQALGEALTEYFATLDSDAGIRAQNGRILRTFDYCDSRNIDDMIDRAIVPALAASPVEQPAAAPFDPAAQYNAASVHIGSGLPKASCPCGLCEKMRAASATDTGADGEPKRGTPAQIRLERWLTCEMIDGAMAFGYLNTNPPPSDDHWLAQFWKIGRTQAEVTEDRDTYKRMLDEAGADLGAIEKALGIDPDEAGGAAPILNAIEKLKARAEASPTAEAVAVPVEWDQDAAIEALSDFPKGSIWYEFLEEVGFDPTSGPIYVLTVQGRAMLDQLKSAYFAAPQPAQADAPAEARELVRLTGFLTVCLRTELKKLDNSTLKALEDVETQLEAMRNSAPADAGEAVKMPRALLAEVMEELQECWNNLPRKWREQVWRNDLLGRLLALHGAPPAARVANEPAPSLTNPLTPFGMLVRSLRIVASTNLYEMAECLSMTPAQLSAMEFGRRPVTHTDACGAADFFETRGIPGMLPALQAAIDAARSRGQA
ncbi:hypothetical protein [Burkholderia sp. MSHR3999]|uniref:hypothetical protein n=1 Tax=Burkholderia sp. MSHR3999 TaxID=1542965 RepID=UPI0006974337|nr:hypothetical protein [Burkholderia sp. MSHR3999]